jgi:hypothetical protein
MVVVGVDLACLVDLILSRPCDSEVGPSLPSAPIAGCSPDAEKMLHLVVCNNCQVFVVVAKTENLLHMIFKAGRRLAQQMESDVSHADGNVSRRPGRSIGWLSTRLIRAQEQPADA